MRQRLFATTASFVLVCLTAFVFQNCAGGGSSSTGNGGGYGGQLSLFYRMACVTDQPGGNGSSIQVEILDPSEVESFRLSGAFAEYITPQYTLSVDLSGSSSTLPGELNINDGGTIRTYTAQCERR